MADYRLIQGDCIESMKALPAGSVQCCVTSPPYYGLRDYGHEGQIGLEETPEEYVAKLVDVFREVRRLLRDDGTLWLNLGDSFSTQPAGNKSPSGFQQKSMAGESGALAQFGSSPRRIGSNLADCLERLIKGGAFFLGGACALTIAAKSDKVLTLNGGTPDGKLATFFGVQRVFIKQRDNYLLQVLNLLNSKSCVRVSPAVTFVRVDDANLEIILDEMDNISIVIADDDLNTKATFGIPVRPDTAKDTDVPFPIKESAEPVTECIGNIKTIWESMQPDTVGKSFFQVNSVHDLIAGCQSLAADTEGLGDFTVTKASTKHLDLSLANGRIDIACSGVAHLFFSNSFGSLVRYSELYDKAQRKANAQQSKQELGIPEMVKRALMEDGWICRSTIIWHKPNPMPESVTDRPTKSHEYIFLLSKSSSYFYDANAIREPQAAESAARYKYTFAGPKQYARAEVGAQNIAWNDGDRSINPDGRNKRSVWTVTTKPYAEAHFATYPPDLIEPCILAGSRVGDTVLDPFNGSGTTGAVALKHGRNYIGCELNPDYIELAHNRIRKSQPMLLEVTP